MTGLKQQLRDDLTIAMKDRDDLRVRTLRITLTEISKQEVSGKSARQLGDDEIQRILGREAKRRREAAEAFDAAGRADQAAAERAEGDVLASYLPAQLSDDELSALVAEAIAAAGATEASAMGQIMRLATPKVAGRAEGARVAGEVRRQLAGT